MATVVFKYSAFERHTRGPVDLLSDDIRLALLLNTYTPDLAHTVWADVSAHEAAAGGGYTAGGNALTNKALSNVAWTADPVVFSSLTKTFRYGLIYANQTYGATVKPLLAYVLYDDTPDDVTVSGVNFQSAWSAAGICTY